MIRTLIHSCRTYMIALAIVAGANLSATCQTSELDDLHRKFDAFRSKTLQEKIYVHTDRSAYLTGETIWFKIYLTDGSFHKPLSLSKVVYLEIIDSDSRPVLQTKIPMSGGKGNGSLYLPPTINSGNYILRAYTNWMKNFPSDFFFSKPVTVLNTFRKIEGPTAYKTSEPDIQFFPEGGNLVHGLTGKVAFRATDASGKGIDFEGAVLNARNDTVTTFRPFQFGIGNFLFTPRAHERYRVFVRQTDGKQTVHNLPDVFENGYTLALTDTCETKLHILVKSTLSQLPVYLFVNGRNIVSTKAVSMISDGRCTFVIDKNTLAEGISHITLFDTHLRPVCERLYFKRPENLLTIKVQQGENTSYLNRRKVTLDLSTLTKNNRPRSSDLSVSVYRLDSLPQHPGNMITTFWLTSDLKGTIESPEYYFRDASPEVSTATDNLMLSHGWRRFQWDEVMDQEVATPFIPEYRGHIIRGVVKNEDGSPAPGIITYLSTPGKIVRLYTAMSKMSGEVLFEMQKFHGSSRVIVQTNYAKDSTYRIELVSPFSDQPLSERVAPLKVSSHYGQSLLDRSVSMQVQDIYYEEKLEASARITSDSSAFYGIANETYYLDDYTRFPVMEEVMREYVKGVWVRKRRDGFHFRVLDHVNHSVFDNTPLILLDGIPLFHADAIMKFDPLKIKKLDVMTRRYYLGPISFPGVVSYRTYTGDLAGFELDPRSIKIDYEGLQLQREFYSPRYDNLAQRRSRMPDQRTLLYWNPQAITDKTGNLQVEFFTSDVSGLFQVVVEGMTDDGQVGSSTATFEVRVEQ